MKFSISIPNDEKFEVEVNDTGSISDLKKAIAAVKGIPSKDIRVFDPTNKIAKNSQKLLALGFQNGDSVQALVVKTEQTEQTLDHKKVFNAFVKKIQDQSGSEDTQTEIIMLIENPKVQETFEALSCDPKYFRQLVDENPILQKNPAFEQCLIETFEMLGAQCAPKSEAVTIENVCKTFGIKYDDDLKEKLKDPEIAQAFEDILDGVKLVGGLNVLSSPPPKHVKLSLQKIFEPELNQFHAMGFFDDQKILRCLQKAGGDISAAVEFLYANVD